MYGYADVCWKGDALHLSRTRDRKLLRIVPDAKYPNIMWRVELPNGNLTDMANRTWAKDAGTSIALAELNNRETQPGGAGNDFEGGGR